MSKTLSRKIEKGDNKQQYTSENKKKETFLKCESKNVNFIKNIYIVVIHC